MYLAISPQKCIRHHPIKGFARLRVNQKAQYLTHKEVQRLLTTTCGDLHVKIVTTLGTAMRANEVLALDRGYVNLNQGVAVRPETKNHDRRVVLLSLQVVEMFRHCPMDAVA